MSSIKQCKYCGAECDKDHNCLDVERNACNGRPPPKFNYLKRQMLRVKRASGAIYVYERKVGKDWDTDPNLYGWYAPTDDYKNGYCTICKQVFQPRKASLVNHGRRYHQRLIDMHMNAADDNLDQDVAQEERLIEEPTEEEEEEVSYGQMVDEEEEEEEVIHKDMDTPSENEYEETISLQPTSPQMSMSVADNDNSLEASLPNDPMRRDEHYLNDAWTELRAAKEQLVMEKKQFKSEKEEFARTKLEFQKQEKIFYGLLKHFNIDLEVSESSKTHLN